MVSNHQYLLIKNNIYLIIYGIFLFTTGGGWNNIILHEIV